MSHNQLLALLLNGDAKGAVEAFEALSAPTAEDTRYGGVALLNLGQVAQAKNRLLQARAGGCLAAGIELASAYRQLGEFAVAERVLEQLEPSALSTFDRVLYDRERGALAFDVGDLSSAIAALEDAWALTFEAEQGDALRPGIAHVIGAAYSARGADQRAAEYYGNALETANLTRKVYIQLARARSYTYIGHYPKAQADLLAARKGVEKAPLLLPILYYNQGLLERVQGRLRQAAKLFQKCVALAQRGCYEDVEVYAELSLCAIYIELNELPTAREHLACARPKVTSERAAAVLALREGALLKQLEKAHAGEYLIKAASAFERLGLYREAGWSWLHLADLALQHGSTELCSEHLAKAADARYAIGNGAVLAFELRALPTLLKHITTLGSSDYAYVLYGDHLKIGRGSPKLLQLITLGSAQLLVDGQPVRLDLSRSIEVLSYLLLNPDTRLEPALATLFPDADPKLAKNYFHQTRYDLERAVPGLGIPFEPSTRSYRVRLDGPSLVWDLERLKYALNIANFNTLGRVFDLYTGPFLPLADSRWAEMEREDVAWSVLKVGLQIIETSFREGRYADCFSLASRLLEIDPYNEVLGHYLVQATRQLEGEVSARLSIERLCQRFEGDLGEIPPALAELRGDLRRLN